MFNAGLIAKPIALSILISMILSCDSDGSKTVVFNPEQSGLDQIDFSSPAFKNRDLIPTKFTCYGENLSPPLRWSDLPSNSRSIAIVMDDTYLSSNLIRHWSIYNIPVATRSLESGFSTKQVTGKSLLTVKNDFERYDYNGPCPPTGEEHEYVFFIYALSQPLEVLSDPGPIQFTNAIRGYVIATGSFSGRYAVD